MSEAWLGSCVYSPLLINVHLLNICVTLLDFYTFPRRLTNLDLHIAITVRYNRRLHACYLPP